ncbi:ABC transporter permease [Streptacidiphilus sp. PB12-B1b]|uniref:ABC transporter permease n=1 Tax=Streptacidiphilus sp. PB12-B1b TaxID=2705012 RepID=UPI0015FA67CB|nr:ABC transporter permease [Streptacidiphilus sp. PB12-B1b]QMU77871.1 ABC transporter permease [Streptacidiphilus sp. PB12-B1b]
MTVIPDIPSGVAPADAVPPGNRPAGGAAAVLRRLWSRPGSRVALVAVALLVLAALAAPWLAGLEGQDPDTYHDELLNSVTGGSPLGSFGGISSHHWLGVEPTTGRDLFARLVYGARISLSVAAGATLGQLLLGLLVGLSAGLAGRRLDALLSRFTDLALSLPSLFFSIALLAVVPASFPRPLLLCIILAVFGWASTARIVRAETMVLREREYVSAALLTGAGTWWIARREILPGLVAPVVTYTALALPGNMVAEAGLSFLGLGVRPPTPSWGQMLSGATTWFQVDPTYVLIPALTLLLCVLAFTALGESLRVALDPRAARTTKVRTTGRVRTAKARATDADRTTAADRTNPAEEAGR